LKTVSVVVNARKGSSRVENKLLRDFAGTSLIEVALAKVNRLDFAEHRYLAVAEPEFKELAAGYGNVEVLERSPAAVRRGLNPPQVTFEHYTRVPSDYVFTINPCAAFVSEETLRRAFAMLQETDAPSLMAAVRTGDWIFDSCGAPLTHRSPAGPQATNLAEHFYRATHCFYLVDRARFAETGVLWRLEPGDPHLIEMPEEEAHDVDTPEQFEFASYLYARRQGGFPNGPGLSSGE
jgi:CMP-N-acetylneuraminic acid synthetase